MKNLSQILKEVKLSVLKKDNFLYLSLLCFILVSTTTLLISKNSLILKRVSKITIKNKQEARTYIPLPVLVKDYRSFPITSAQAVLAIDLDSRVPLYEKNSDVPLLPASTTKIITALVAMDYYPFDTLLTVNGRKTDGQKMGLVNGEIITAGSLLEGLLIHSANDAAEVLADNYLGGINGFVDAMNRKSKQLELKNTHFENPTGFDNNDHVSTARDLIFVAEVAMQNPKFAEIVGKKEAIVASIDGKIKHKLVNTNELLGKESGVLGVKTGWTENARENLVTYLERDGKKIMIALLGSQDRFGETKEIIDWVFANYLWQEVKYPS